MTDVTTCAGCGAQYVRVTSSLCVECGAPLLGPVLAPGGDEVGYELDDWAEELRDTLTAALGQEGVPIRWEETELVVAEESADRVEALIDQLESEGAAAAAVGDEDGDDDDEPAGAEVLSALYVSADVLQHEPANDAAVAELLQAVDAIPERPPYGIDKDTWSSVCDRADALADLLAEEADIDLIATTARALRESVRPLV